MAAAVQKIVEGKVGGFEFLGLSVVALIAGAATFGRAAKKAHEELESQIRERTMHKVMDARRFGHNPLDNLKKRSKFKVNMTVVPVLEIRPPGNQPRLELGHLYRTQPPMAVFLERGGTSAASPTHLFLTTAHDVLTLLTVGSSKQDAVPIGDAAINLHREMMGAEEGATWEGHLLRLAEQEPTVRRILDLYRKSDVDERLVAIVTQAVVDVTGPVALQQSLLRGSAPSTAA